MTEHPPDEDVTRLSPTGEPKDAGKSLAGRPSPGDRYRLGMALGEGGMAVVVEAEDAALGRVVALKRLRPELRREADAIERFFAEAEIMATLEHPGVVPVHDAGVMPDGDAFYTMAKVRGRTLGGLRVRSNQENADKVWVLKVCQNRDDAHYWETLYAFNYGIPTTVFHVRGRRMSMSQGNIDRLFSEIDTMANAQRLLADLEMDERYPHFTPQGTFRNTVNLRYFGDGRTTTQSPWHAHRVDLWSSEPDLADRLKSLGYNPRIRSRQNWRIGLNRLQYDDIQLVAQKLSQDAGNAEIVVGAFLTEVNDSHLAPRFRLMPASHLHSTMILAIEKDGRIIEDEIIEIAVCRITASCSRARVCEYAPLPRC